MTTNQMRRDYARGMDYLDLVAPVFANFVRAMGIPHDNPNIPTACVTWDAYSKRVSFQMNSTFAEGLTDEGMAAAMAHECYHLLLEHLKETMQRDKYPQAKVLIAAHECIINDGLKANVGVELPKGFWSGPETFDKDFSYFSTKQAYDFIMDTLKDQEQEQGEGEGQEGDGQGDSQGQSSGKGSGKGGSKSDSQDGSGSGDKTEDQADGQEDEEQDGSGQGQEKGDQEQDGKSEDGSGAGDGDEEADGDPQGCGGFDFENMSDQDLKDFQKAVEKMVNQVVDEVGEENIPDDVADMISDMVGKDMGRGGASGSMFYAPDLTKDMALDFAEIIAIINPKVLSSGKPKPQESWQRVPRRLTSIYPNVILPDRKRQVDDPNAKGNEVPTFVVALDLSSSIPRSLVSALMKLMDAVPTKLISPRAITWSDNVQVWDERRQMVRPGGTNVDAVYRYAKEVAKEIGSDPYVLNITDGQCYFSGNVDTKYLMEKWFWCAIQPQDLRSIEAYFVRAGHANPKYVYKLSDLTR